MFSGSRVPVQRVTSARAQLPAGRNQHSQSAQAILADLHVRVDQVEGAGDGGHRDPVRSQRRAMLSACRRLDPSGSVGRPAQERLNWTGQTVGDDRVQRRG